MTWHGTIGNLSRALTERHLGSNKVFTSLLRSSAPHGVLGRYAERGQFPLQSAEALNIKRLINDFMEDPSTDLFTYLLQSGLIPGRITL